MPSEKEYQKLIADLMKAQAQEDGLDPNEIESNNVRVDASGPTVEVAYGGATVRLPGPSRAALDQWFKDNGQYIAGALTTLVAVAAGAAGAAALINKNNAG